MLTHKGTQTIQTPRLTLRRFTIADATAMFQNWANDERVTRFLTWRPHPNPELTRQLLQEWCTEYEKPDTYNWVIVQNGDPIGGITVVRLNERDEWAELGYCIGFSHWNKGITAEAAAAVIDYLFAEVGFHRIGIAHAVDNPASGRVAQKCGLTYEGTKRQYAKTGTGEYHDIREYAILRSDWEAKRSPVR